MIDINRHRVVLVQILKDIYSDPVLANILGFKGGSAMMFFYGLPRFSVDLDFNLIDREKESLAYREVRIILLKYGNIFDEAPKFHGPLLVLDYGTGERKLKVEISNRVFNDRYEIKDLLGISLRVMVLSDMFAHKLCALLDRGSMAGRDIFDCWFFMKNQSPLNRDIIETRMQVTYTGYIQKCIDRLQSASGKKVLQDIGELLDEELKKFVRTGLVAETVSLLKFYRDYPILT